MLDVVLRNRLAILVVAIATMAVTGWLYVSIQKGFIPQQDTGWVQGQAQAATDISFADMSTKMQALAHIVMDDRAVDNVAY